MPSNPWHEDDDECLCEHCTQERLTFQWTSLQECFDTWSRKLGLVTWGAANERLAQEASLFMWCEDIAHES